MVRVRDHPFERTLIETVIGDLLVLTSREFPKVKASGDSVMRLHPACGIENLRCSQSRRQERASRMVAFYRLAALAIAAYGFADILT
jgi:hypothetical protein